MKPKKHNKDLYCGHWEGTFFLQYALKGQRPGMFRDSKDIHKFNLKDKHINNPNKY